MNEKCEYCNHCLRLYVPPIEAYKDIPSNAYVCDALRAEGQVLYMDDNQGKCEMFTPKSKCDTCFIPMFYNLEDDDSICNDCEVGE